MLLGSGGQHENTRSTACRRRIGHIIVHLPNIRKAKANAALRRTLQKHEKNGHKMSVMEAGFPAHIDKQVTAVMTQLRVCINIFASLNA